MIGQKADNELVAELAALVQPGDLRFNELVLQSSFVGTQLPLELSRNRVEGDCFYRHPP
jgi:hypothetical protein